MPYTNQVVIAPVSVRDVQKALSVSNNSLGGLCTHPKINKWAKYKPIRVVGGHPLTDAQRKAAYYGFSISEVTGTPDAIAKMSASASAWVYERPTLGYNFRLDDFNQYAKFAKCPMQLSMTFSVLAVEGLPQAAQLSIDGDVQGLDTQYNVLVGDVFDMTRYANYRLTLAVVDNTVSPSRVLCYYCSPYTLNDPNAMAGEEKIVTVRSMPAAASPTLDRTYTAVLMMTNYTPQTEAECKDGILPSAIANSTAVSLNLDNGNDRFTFQYQQGGVGPGEGWQWVFDHLSINSDGIVSIPGAPANVEVYNIDTLDVDMTSPADAGAMIHNMEVKAKVSINGSHYMWSNTSSGPDDVSTWQKHESGTYDITDWIDVDSFQPNIGGTTGLVLGDLTMYRLTSHPNGYPILLDSTNYPTEITIHIYYRIGHSGSGTQVLGDGGTIRYQGDYIDIQD